MKKTTFRTLLPLLIVCFLAGIATSFVWQPTALTQPQVTTEPKPTSSAIHINAITYKVCFTLSQACLPMIIDELDHAKISIQMQAYSLTSKPIADALIRARARGVSVIVIADKSQRHQRNAQVSNLKRAKISVYIDHKPAIAHNKIIIIDGIITIGGSYNFSNSAEKRNAENVTIIKSKSFAALYSANFKKRMDVSKVFV
jgi:phosphatidylserine/phosphatidylglycerophosphate/cardiolipin synthase-like enzyme